MRHLDLFSGIGGFALAASWTWGKEYVNVGHSEIEEYPCKVYHRHFPDSLCLGDITKIKWTEGQADLITGGFPCQPFSVAGKRRGKEDHRHLWPEMLRAIREVRPVWVVGENVAGIIRMELDQVLSDLETEGYQTETFVIPACAVNAPHRRDRVWIVVNGTELFGNGGSILSGGDSESLSAIPQFRISRSDVSNTQLKRCEEQREERTFQSGSVVSNSWWSVEPEMGRVAYGVSRRVDRLKGLGNAIVPQVAFVIMQAIRAQQGRSE